MSVLKHATNVELYIWNWLFHDLTDNKLAFSRELSNTCSGQRKILDRYATLSVQTNHTHKTMQLKFIQHTQPNNDKRVLGLGKRGRRWIFCSIWNQRKDSAVLKCRLINKQVGLLWQSEFLANLLLLIIHISRF